jgi:hypothetical protein
MASMKMPPRQKMINMMYLVLTAMLAMNVSKEVLDAFAIMDAELVRSERAHEQRSRVEYTVFADAAKRFPDKFGAPHQRALRVKAMADSLVQHIQGMKVRAIAAADGLEVAALQGRDAEGRDTLRALLALEAKDDREVLTRELVGSVPSPPRWTSCSTRATAAMPRAPGTTGRAPTSTMCRWPRASPPSASCRPTSVRRRTTW